MLLKAGVSMLLHEIYQKAKAGLYGDIGEDVVYAFTEKYPNYEIAVDFDGTIAEDRFPDIGNANFDLIEEILYLQDIGVKFILWTCREGQMLEDAVKFCRKFGIEFSAVNNNIERRSRLYGNNSRKVGADEYWDDRATQIRIKDLEENK